MVASISSAELKKGKRLVRIMRRTTPADQMSILVVWLVHLKRTSGARKPRVPARLARREGRESFLMYPVEGVICDVLVVLVRTGFWQGQYEESVPSRSARPKSTSTPRPRTQSYRKLLLCEC